MLTIAVTVGVVTGVILGLLGSGGSILTIPALVYLLKISPKQAIAMSLGIVAISSFISALNHWKRGNVDLKLAAVFGLFSAGGSYLGTRLGVVMPPALQLMLFAAMMYVAAYQMLKPGAAAFKPVGADVVRPESEAVAGGAGLTRRLWHTALVGLSVGALAGAVGVGGGFLIIPALVLLAGTPMKQAIGTTLVIVTFNTLTGFIGYLGRVPIDYPLMAVLTGVIIAGSFVGAMLSHRLSHETLKRSFGVLLVLIASYVVLKSAL
ncbi:MAG: sulfite exporter TauE/SafE family protein [Betaproteobacteria bacterium]|nr:sulfite exporter TauE/SafE family protein [Betaproteobacteria bacterium]